MTLLIPLRLPSAANLREHWRVRHRASVRALWGAR